MGAAIMAALYARDAAKETKRGADEAKRSADEAERSNNAYVARERGHLLIGFPSCRLIEKYGTWPVIALEVNNSGPAPIRIVGQQWELVDGPIWPDKDRLQLESWEKMRVEQSDDGDEITLRVDPPNPDASPFWVIGWLEYETVGVSGFRKHFCLELNYWKDVRDDLCDWIASHSVCAGMPADT